MATLRSQFNERLFEFCVNAELVGQLGSVIAGYLPGIPSPQEERDLGWDANFQFPEFGVTYLLQYKVARRTTAKASRNAPFWDVYGAEYFRFSLHRDRKTKTYLQHEHLLAAAAPGVVPAYVAPAFHEQGSLVAALQSGGVLESSAVIPVASLGHITDSGPHSVTYPVDDQDGQPTMHSEPRRIERIYGESFRRSESGFRLDESRFDRLTEIVADRRIRKRRTPPVERTVRAEDPRAEAFLRAAAVAADELDATLVVVPDGP